MQPYAIIFVSGNILSKNKKLPEIIEDNNMALAEYISCNSIFFLFLIGFYILITL
jgi:hypothetical protein